MKSLEILNTVPRSSVQEHDSLAWRATLAAAQRVMRYYASKAEGKTIQQPDVEALLDQWTDAEAGPRLAA